MTPWKGLSLGRMKFEQVQGLLDDLGLGAVRLGRPENFAWYTGGADNRVDHAALAGVAEIVVTREGDHVVTNTIEGSRMREEQTPGLEVVEYDWYAGADDVIRKLAGDAPVGGDTPGPGTRDVRAAIDPLRYILDDEAIARYRSVAADAVAALDRACASLTPATTETEAAGAVAGECRAAGLFTPVVLVGGDDRVARHRHPVPAGAPLGARALVVVCAERGGLYANLSRSIHFQPPDGKLTRRLEACQEILARLRAATRPGRTLGEVFDECRRLYAEAGFPDEWRHHHQGGLTGYRSREVIAGPGVATEIAVGQAFAWNPSLPGAKAEETFVLTAAGPEVLTS
jgi:Xaa-Pro dipeptidase